MASQSNDETAVDESVAVEMSDFMTSHKNSFEKSGSLEPIRAGYITFEYGSPGAQFVQVESEDHTSGLLDWMWKFWRLPRPQLILSIIGTDVKDGSGNPIKFMKSVVMEMAGSTNAWIITDGRPEGVGRVTGIALKRYLNRNFKSAGNVTLLGVNSWQSLTAATTLVEGFEQYGSGMVDIEDFDKKLPLEANHTHHVLFNEDSIEAGRHLNWRSDFERMLLRINLKNQDVHVPLITLMLSGDKESLRKASETLTNQLPLVVLKGYGGAADLISDALKFLEITEAIDRKVLAERYIHHIGHEEADGVDYLITILKYAHKIIICDTTETDNLEFSILEAAALLEVDGICTARKRLEIALAWDRDDLAEGFLFGPKGMVAQREHWESVFYALCLANKYGFVERLLNRRPVLLKRLSYEKVEDLYVKTLRQIDKSSADFIRAALKKKTKVDKVRKFVCDIVFSPVTSGPPQLEDLIIWAVIFDRCELARILLQYTNDPLGGCILSTALLRELTHLSSKEHSEDITESYRTSAIGFEESAVNTLNNCWSRNKALTSKILQTTSTDWFDIQPLDVAYQASMERFLSQTACYHKLTKIWRGDIAVRCSLIRVVLFCFFPILPFALKFVRKTDQQVRTDERGSRVLKVSCRGIGDDRISWWTAVNRGLAAPIVKFLYAMIVSLLFMVLFSLFVMHELRPYRIISRAKNSTCMTCLTSTSSIGYLEVFTYWVVISHLIDEIKQMFIEKDIRGRRRNLSSSQTLRLWWSDFKNKFDAVFYSVFFLGVVLRFCLVEEYFFWSKIVFCLALVLYSLRFCWNLFAFESIGPKLIMIKRMATNLLFFIVLLVLIILAVGTFTEAVTHPQQTLSWRLLPSIFYRSYWQMYGELSLESYSNDFQLMIPAVYMVLTNILLLNLLIAMFSSDVSEVQQNSKSLWRYHFYALVKENTSRCILIPFSSLTEIAYVIRENLCRSDPRHHRASSPLYLIQHRKRSLFTRQCYADFSDGDFLERTISQPESVGDEDQNFTKGAKGIVTAEKIEEIRQLLLDLSPQSPETSKHEVDSG